MSTPEQDSFPRQNARTLRFTLGRPRSFSVSPDGETVVFVRSSHGTDREGRLWRWTPSAGEVEIVDPGVLLGGEGEELSAEERARRERAREAAGGIVGYSVGTAVRQAAFTLSGRLFVTDIRVGETRELTTPDGAVLDPRIDPTGRRVAFVCSGRLWVIPVDGGEARAITPEEPLDTVTWGTADFISAEEMDRSRGFWWSPDGDRLLVQRTDEAAVPLWYVSSPADPHSVPTPQRYPAAGESNPIVTLWVVSLDGGVGKVDLPDDAEYMATVSWSSRGAPVVATLDRRQQTITWHSVDVETGATQVVRAVTNDTWVDVVPGTGAYDGEGRLLTVEVSDDDYALCANGERLTPTGLNVRGVIDVSDSDLLVLASEDAGSQQVWSVNSEGATRVSPNSGWHAAARGGPTTVLVSADLDTTLPRTTITTADITHEVTSHASEPLIEPRVAMLPGDAARPRIAVVLPTGHEPGAASLPIVMDPYGGPHHARVTQQQGSFREAQWFANQGFGVVVVDGRGTPGAPSWERAVRNDFAGPVLEDQIVGLHAAAHAFPDLDLDRVAIRGWSFGGYLSALAVIDRPDVFHAAIAGAPVTDWLLYDTGYTERYLGIPNEDDPESLTSYERSSLLARAPGLSRPLQLIHGLADDNVFVANTLQLSRVLTENGRPHEVLPLSGITHMATQEDVAENLLLLQVEFLRRSLGGFQRS